MPRILNYVVKLPGETPFSGSLFLELDEQPMDSVIAGIHGSQGLQKFGYYVRELAVYGPVGKPWEIVRKEDFDPSRYPVISSSGFTVIDKFKDITLNHPEIDVIIAPVASATSDAELQPLDGQFPTNNPTLAATLGAVTFQLEKSKHQPETGKLKVDWETATLMNNYSQARQLPGFIATVVKKKKAMPKGDTTFTTKLLGIMEAETKQNLTSRQPDDTIISSIFTDDKGAPCGEIMEVEHYRHALIHIENVVGPNILRKRVCNMSFAFYLVLAIFGEYWESMDKTHARYQMDQDFPYPIIAEVGNKKYKYRPRPDFALLKSEFPCFLVEFDSGSNHDDEQRLRVQMATTVRLARTLRPQSSGEDSAADDNFLMGAFFTKNWAINRYFFYIGSDDEVYFNCLTVPMSSVPEVLGFLHEFYNYAQHIKLNWESVGAETRTEGLTQYIDNNFKDSLNTVQKKSQPSRPSNKRGRPDDDSGTATGSNIQAPIQEALQRSGFTLGAAVYEDGFEPLYKLPPHVVEAVRPGTGNTVIAKLLHKHSHEATLLREFSAHISSHNHVIPLLDTLETTLGPLIILPSATPLPLLYNCAASLFPNLCNQFIEGVAFIHRHGVAHMDLKPANLVYSEAEGRLWIIDLDHAMHCSDGDIQVTMAPRGTPGWAAPEVGLKDTDDVALDWDMSLHTFNPVRADLWSCGKVLLCFASKLVGRNLDVHHLATLLMSSEPSRRPLLHKFLDEESGLMSVGDVLRKVRDRPQADGSTLKRVLEEGSEAEELVRKIYRKGDDPNSCLPTSVSPLPSMLLCLS